MSNPARKNTDKYAINSDEKLGVGSFGGYIGVQNETQQYAAIKMSGKKTSICSSQQR